MPNIDLDDLDTPVATSLSKDFAEKFAKFAAHGNEQLYLFTLEAQPGAIIMLGKPEE